jgi:hypothetical protein
LHVLLFEQLLVLLALAGGLRLLSHGALAGLRGVEGGFGGQDGFDRNRDNSLLLIIAR